MNYTFFTNSEKTWKALYEDISCANKSISMEMYIFENTREYNFYELLQKKSQEWLRVILILDAFGSINLTQHEIDAMKQSGVEILFQSYFFHRAHRKITIIDESVAFIGGVNIHNVASRWNDLVVRVEGFLVKNIIKSLIKSYRDAGGKDETLLQSKNTSLEKVNAWIIEHSPFRKIFNLKRIYTQHLSHAQKRITLVTPYFIPKRWLRALLHQAVLRWVIVEVLVPEHTDHRIIDRVNYFFMRRLALLGVKFYLETTMNHAKLMVIDDNEWLVGSQNLDILSFDFNSEIGVFFEDREVVSQLTKIADDWKKDATIFDPLHYQSRWFDVILSSVIGFFSRIF